MTAGYAFMSVICGLNEPPIADMTTTISRAKVGPPVDRMLPSPTGSNLASRSVMDPSAACCRRIYMLACERIKMEIYAATNVAKLGFVRSFIVEPLDTRS